MTADRPVDRTRKILMMVGIALSIRALFGDEVGAFLDGMIMGFTDGT